MNIALIGQGFMGRAHSNAYNQVVHFFDSKRRPRLKLLCGRNRESLGAMAERWGWEEVTTDWREAVTRADIDAVDIAAPNSLHARIAIAAAEAGKMVFCEKPMANTLDEARRMVEAARRVRTMVWFNYRRVPAIAFAKRLIDEGRLGRIFHYRATYLQQWGNDPSRKTGWKLDRVVAGSGVTGDLLSHLFDTALALNGPISRVSAMQSTFEPGREIDDAVAVLAEFANGSKGTFEATRYAVGAVNQNRLEIHGSRGMLAFNLEDLNRLEFHDASLPASEQGPRSILVTAPGHPYGTNFWKPGHIIGYEHTFIAVLGDFLRALDEDALFHPNFEDGLEVQSLLDAVERSSLTRAWTTPETVAAQRPPNQP